MSPRSHPVEPCWQVSIMRGKKAERLGEVRAKDEAEAIDRAMVEFELQPWAAAPGAGVAGRLTLPRELSTFRE